MKAVTAIAVFLSLALKGCEAACETTNSTTTTVSTKTTTSPYVTMSPAALGLQQARPYIEALIADNERLAPLFVRMGFHDCITICDGCLDMTNLDNTGLGIPIDAIQPVVEMFALPQYGLSRADIWAFAATVAADVASNGTTPEPIDFTMNWVGRVDCENAHSVCYNSNGHAVSCSYKTGPARTTPSVTFNTQQTFGYFQQYFNFTPEDATAIMGFHTLGKLSKNNSGISGPNGWDHTPTILQNGYYLALFAGPPDTTTPIAVQASNIATWRRTFEANNGHPFPNRNYWTNTFENVQNVMLNSDVGIVINLTAHNTNPNTGAVSCTFVNATGTPVCPIASTFSLAGQYAANNTFWLLSLKDAWDRMLSNGYYRAPCSQIPCPLELMYYR